MAPPILLRAPPIDGHLSRGIPVEALQNGDTVSVPSLILAIAGLLSTQQSEPNNPVGPYLGQNPPGDVPVIFAGNLITRTCPVHSPPVFTPDLREVYWGPMSGPGCAQKTDEILFMERLDHGWTEPESVGFSSLLWDSDDPAMAPDGERLYFTTKRPSGFFSFDFEEKVMYVVREGDGWSSPRSVGTRVNDMFRHWQVSVTQTYDLYFSAEENVETPAIYVSRFVDGEYQKPERLPDKINSGISYHPHVAPDESYLLFVRTLPETGDDLFISFKQPSGEWTEAVNLGDKVNSGSHDFCPTVSPDGKYLFFISQRNGDNKVFWVDAGVIDGIRPTD